MSSDATIVTVVNARQVRDAVISLRVETVRALARCRDMLDRMEPRPEPDEMRDAPR